MSRRRFLSLSAVLLPAVSLLPLAAAQPLVASGPTLSGARTAAEITAFAAQVAPAGNRTCALTRDGAVMCWGLGPLGDGTWRQSDSPVIAIGLGSGVAAIAAGDEHTCALLRGGTVKCWGSNFRGQIGDGTTEDLRLTPVEVVGLSDVVRLEAGFGHTCAVTASGALKCWGDNESGQLGDGTTTQRNAPVTVSGLASGALSVSAGTNHTCALSTRSDGGTRAQCWGSNWYGQLGDGTTTQRLTPVTVYGLGKEIVQVSAGGIHTCALGGGALKCWGANDGGQLGTGDTLSHYYPVDVLGLSTGVFSISAGAGYTCANVASSDIDSGAMCWGSNQRGEVGTGTVEDRWLEPVPVRGLASGVAAVAAGGAHTCATMRDGGIKCWGLNWDGQLGEGAQLSTPLPVTVPGAESGAVAVATGGYHTCALFRTAAEGFGLKCWGANHAGQLGDGTKASRFMAEYVFGLKSGVVAVAAGSSHTCAVLSGGEVRCWGANGSGEIGNCGSLSEYPYPAEVAGLPGAVAVSAGSSYSCALTGNGAVKCWGANDSGQLGNGTNGSTCAPRSIASVGLPFVAVDASMRHTCGVTSDGGAKCWGANSYGQLGTGEMAYWGELSPVDVVGLTGATAVTTGGEWYEGVSHTCAVTSAGTAKCWGANNYGQLGNGTTIPRYEPFDVAGLGAGTVAVSAGGFHTCALAEGVAGDRRVKCWGMNYAGQLGDGTTGEKSVVPRDVVGLEGGAAAVAAGAYHSCAVTSAGAVKCWGSSEWGQAGLNPGLAPVDVPGFGSVDAYTPTPSPTATASVAPEPSPTPTGTPEGGPAPRAWLPLIYRQP